MATGSEPKIKGTGQLLLINAVIHAGLAFIVYAIGGAKCSIGSIDGGIIFGIQGFIFGPLVMHKTSKLAGERFSRDGDVAMGAVFGIMVAGVVSAPFYVVMCGL